MVQLLPDCPKHILHTFLEDKKWEHSPTFSSDGKEVWFAPDGLNYATINDKDPVPFLDLIMIVNLQMKMEINEIPFYAEAIAQRFRPDGSFAGS